MYCANEFLSHKTPDHNAFNWSSLEKSPEKDLEKKVEFITFFWVQIKWHCFEILYFVYMDIMARQWRQA